MRGTERALLYSYLIGMDHAAGALALADDGETYPDPLPFDEAVKFMKARVPVSRPEWKVLEPQMRFRAFAVSRLAEIDSVEAVRGKLVSVLEKGGTVEGFWSDAGFQGIAGVGEQKPWYWETVYRTNIQTAYNAGRAAEITRSNPPYLEFIGIEDDRQTETCAQRSGVVLPSSHPWWSSNWPPLHFNCRSTVRPVYEDDLEEEGLAVAQDGTTEGIGKAAGSFGSNPIETGSFYRMTEGMVQRAEKYGILDEIRQLAKDLGLSSDPLMTSIMANEGRLASSTISIPRGKADRNALRKTLEKKLLATRDSPITNGYLGEDVELNRTGIEKAIAFSGAPEKIAALDSLRELIERAMIIAREADSKGKTDFSEVLKGRVALEYGGKRHLFELVLKRKKSDGKLVFYEILPYVMK